MNAIPRHRFRSPLLAATAIIACFPSQGAYAQQFVGRARRASEDIGRTLRQVNQIGLFTVDARRSRPTSRAGRPSAVDPSAAAAAEMFGGRPLTRNRLTMPGTTYTQARRSSAMLSYFGRSQAAVWFAPPPYTGQGRSTYPVAPAFSNPETDKMIAATATLSFLRGYHHRALLPLEGGGIRDALTRESLQNPYPIPEDLDALARPRRTHAQKLKAKIGAMRTRYLEQGWQYLGKRDYLRSRNAFDSASRIDTEDLEPRVGKWLCAIADQQYNTAGAYLVRLVKHHEDLFTAQYSFADVFADEQVGESILAKCAALSEAQPDSDVVAALHVYALWLDGQRTAASDAAAALRDRFRASRFALFADKIREQMRSEQTDRRS